MTWIVSRHGEEDDEVFDTEKEAMEREDWLTKHNVKEVVAWFDSESDGPWVEPVTQISTRFEGDNWTALREGA